MAPPGSTPALAPTWSRRRRPPPAPGRPAGPGICSCNVSGFANPVRANLAAERQHPHGFIRAPEIGVTAFLDAAIGQFHPGQARTTKSPISKAGYLVRVHADFVAQKALHALRRHEATTDRGQHDFDEAVDPWIDPRLIAQCGNIAGLTDKPKRAPLVQLFQHIDQHSCRAIAGSGGCQDVG